KSFALAGTVLATTLGLAHANDTKVALVPGGPHPYFASWAQGGADAKRDFNLGAADFKVPQKWELSTQNNLLENLVTQGYNAFLIFPGDPVGSVSTVAELADTGAPVIALAGCLKDPSKASFCFGTDTGHSAYLGTQHLIAGLKGTKMRILHLTGFLVDPNTQLPQVHQLIA
ncbi:MAG: sugar ABC transporter substrate-binding protein, partial [Alphaproteobacteria bacterium]|nr:sugar ABC transporter substrate-binding protein [Alphaproteobacteria bacterium]